MDDKLAQAILRCFESSAVNDIDGQPASVVDGLYAIAGELRGLGDELRQLTQPATTEHLLEALRPKDG